MTGHLAGVSAIPRAQPERVARTRCAPTRAISRSFSVPGRAPGVTAARPRPRGPRRGLPSAAFSASSPRGHSRRLGGPEAGGHAHVRRYLRREGVIDDDPARSSRRRSASRRIPAHLGEDEMGRLLETPDIATAARAARSRDARAVLCVGAASQRARRAGSRRCEFGGTDGAGARQGGEGAARAVQHATAEARSDLSADRSAARATRRHAGTRAGQASRSAARGGASRSS